MSRLQFTVRESTSPPALIIELVGTIDSSKSMEKVFEVINRSSATQLVILMDEVDYVNSAGFADIILLNEKAKKDGKALVFSELNIKVKSVFEHLGGLSLLEVEPTEAEALKRFSAA